MEEVPCKQDVDSFETSKDTEAASDDERESPYEEVEPKLKYVRIVNDLQNILCKDAASCIAVHPKFICLGSQWGALHLFDHQGNSVRSQDLPTHTVLVNQISIDERGDHIASCSDDGKVFIHGLYSSENSQSLSLGRLVKAVAIDPLYYKPGSGRRFITGDERLMMHEKAFLGRVRSSVLAPAEGRVLNARWSGRFLAWASTLGLRILDTEARCSLGLIKWRCTPGLLPENYQCSLFWKDTHTLLVAWVDLVKVCVVHRRSPVELIENKALPEFKVVEIYSFPTDFLLAGIAPLNELLVLLGCPKEQDNEGKSLRPQLYVMQPLAGGEFEELSTDCLSLRGYQAYTCNDYHLDCLVEENRFFIVSPKDIVVASPYDADDRIQWLIERSKFEKAMEEVSRADGKELKRHSLLSVGRSFLDTLLNSSRYTDAAKLCVRILGQDQKLWEEEVFKFARHQQLRALSPYLPRGSPSGQLQLNPHVYEMVLYEYIKTDHTGFLDLVKKWPPTLYNLPAVVNAVMEHLLQNRSAAKDKIQLLEALAILYLHQKKFSEAFCMLVKFRNKEVFGLIKKHEHYDCLSDLAESLMELDSTRATALFLEQNIIAPAKIVAALEHHKYLLFLYLDALERRDGKKVGKQFQHLLVGLYAEYARERLLPFLRHNDQYPIETAREICEQRCFYPELVYLLGRIGSTQKALHLIIEELQDIEQAVEFCRQHDDKDLWEYLINESINKPEFVTYLLQTIGTYIDPQILVKKIIKGSEIPGLKKSLVKMMCDYNLQVSVQEGCKKILVADYFNLHKRQVTLQTRGVAIHSDNLCGACQRPSIATESGRAENLIVFYCRHAFHQECLSMETKISCMVCQPARRASSHLP